MVIFLPPRVGGTSEGDNPLDTKAIKLHHDRMLQPEACSLRNMADASYLLQGWKLHRPKLESVIPQQRTQADGRACEVPSVNPGLYTWPSLSTMCCVSWQ